MKTLTLSNEDLTYLDRAIQELPMRIALPLINKINEQLKQQAEEEVNQPADNNVS